MMRRSITAVLFAAWLVMPHVNVNAQGDSTFLPKYEAGFSAGLNILGNDFTKGFQHYRVQPIINVNGAYLFVPEAGIRACLLGGQFGTNIKDPVVGNYIYQAVFLGGSVNPFYRFPKTIIGVSPIVEAAFGFMGKKTTISQLVGKAKEDWKLIPTIGIGIGGCIPLSQRMDLRIMFQATLTNSDELDGIRSGVNHDGYTAITAGLTWRIPPASRNSTVEYSSSTTTRFGRLAIKLFSAPFHSLRQLQERPERVRLNVRRTTSTPTDIAVEFHLRHDTTEVVRGTSIVTLFSKSDTLNALEIVNFSKLFVRPGYDTLMPRGKYTVTVVVRAYDAPQPVVASTTFQNMNVAPLFGSQAKKVEAMIEKGEAEVAEADTSGMLVLRTFTSPQSQYTSGNGHGQSDTTAEDSNRAPGYTILPEALTTIPADLPEEERASYIAEKVSNAFRRAHTLLDMARQADNRSSIPDVVVAAVYFGNGQTNLSDEARMILDVVASELVINPSFTVDVRGYADEIGDVTYNLGLSRQRAEKVVEHLVRNRVSTLRLTALPLGKIDNEKLRPKQEQQFNRRVEIVLTGVKDK
jgi:outer membrane protein OmpA-like peptidoglycan-associated protein